MSLHVSYGDDFTYARDEDGAPAVRVQNAVWVEDARWITFGTDPVERARQVRELIDALQMVAGAVE